MDWKAWYRSLTAAERDAYAERAGTKRAYIETKLIFKKAIPRPDLMQKLADASLGRVRYDDLVRFFYAKEAA